MKSPALSPSNPGFFSEGREEQDDGGLTYITISCVLSKGYKGWKEKKRCIYVQVGHKLNLTQSWHPPLVNTKSTITLEKAINKLFTKVWKNQSKPRVSEKADVLHKMEDCIYSLRSHYPRGVRPSPSSTPEAEAAPERGRPHAETPPQPLPTPQLPQGSPFPHTAASHSPPAAGWETRSLKRSELATTR